MTTQNSAGPAPRRRQDRRREATRRRLIDAARTLMAQRGVEGVGITDITEAADLGAGTFYNYFSSRDEIVTHIIRDSIDTVGDALDRMTADMDDPAEVYASSLRHLVQQATSLPLWGWFMVRLGIAHPQLQEVLGPRCRRDLRRGAESGRFTVVDLDLAVASTFGSLLSTIHLAVSQNRTDDLDVAFAATMLSMVGLPLAEAHEVATRPLPPLPMESMT
ncbi:TetR/AcrR family transcriptional regulator [Streptomyces sp. NPDC001315]|uniref:TetR/AcrR family transcriptional regulator n=1 Tax=Streptomyces sp. NPDC001315 TaxID=3364562 RepID=UPI0036819DD4